MRTFILLALAVVFYTGPQAFAAEKISNEVMCDLKISVIAGVCSKEADDARIAVSDKDKTEAEVKVVLAAWDDCEVQFVKRCTEMLNENDGIK